MEVLTHFKGIHIHQEVIGGAGLILKYWASSICHACPTVIITSKDFTGFQIIWLNPPVELEIN